MIRRAPLPSAMAVNATGVVVGASLIATTLSEAVSVVALKGVVPPVALIVTTLPALPDPV